MQAFQLRIDLGGMGGMGGMQGAAMGGGSAGQSATDGAFAGMVANAGAADTGAPKPPSSKPAAPAASQASGKGIGAENLQVLQPDAATEAPPAGVLPVDPAQVDAAAPLPLENGSAAAGLVPGLDVTDDAAAGDAATGDEADALTGEAPVLMAFAMPLPLPAPQAAVPAPLDGATDGVLDGAGGLDTLEGADGLRGSIQPFAPSLPQTGGDAASGTGSQPDLATPDASMAGIRNAGMQSTDALSGGSQLSDADALASASTDTTAVRVRPAVVEAGQPVGPAAVLPAGAEEPVQQAQSETRLPVGPASGGGLEAALVDAGLTAGSGETVSDDLLKLAGQPFQTSADVLASAADAQTDAGAAVAQNQTQSQPQPQSESQSQPSVQPLPQAATAQPPQVPAQPLAAVQTQAVEVPSDQAGVSAAGDADAQDSSGVESLRFAFAASAGADATAAAAKPELVAQQAVASSVASDASDSLTETAAEDAVSAREAASTALDEAVEERLADQERSRYGLPSDEGARSAGQSAAARGTQASDLAGASAAINSAQAAGEAASSDAANADSASDPVVALDGRPGQMDFTGFGRADGTTGAMTGATQPGTAGTAGQMPTQAQAQAAASQVAGQIQLQSRAGQSRFQMRLDPPELGRIEVHMKVKAGGEVEAHLIVDKPETLDMFMRDQKGLERALEQAGLKADQGSLQFSLRDEGNSRQFAFSGDGQGNGSGQSGRQDQQQGQDSLTAEQNMAERVVQLYRQNGRTGVDIRI